MVDPVVLTEKRRDVISSTQSVEPGETEIMGSL